MPESGAHSAAHAHQFEDAEQQREAGSLGMWVFLATEIMFFGGLFAGYAIYRSLYLQAFEAGSKLLDIRLGATNTVVLLTSSLTMALGVHASQTNRRKALVFFLILTILLGSVFLGIKYNEYTHKWQNGLVPGLRFAPTETIPGGADLSHVEMFFCFYFFMTGLHALHMIIGIAILAVLTVMAARGKFSARYYAPVEISGLYWHFVDIIWIFLYPLLYLLGRHF